MKYFDQSHYCHLVLMAGLILAVTGLDLSAAEGTDAIARIAPEPRIDLPARRWVMNREESYYLQDVRLVMPPTWKSMAAPKWPV